MIDGLENLLLRVCWVSIYDHGPTEAPPAKLGLTPFLPPSHPSTSSILFSHSVLPRCESTAAAGKFWWEWF